MDEENDEWKRLMEEKLLHFREKPSEVLDSESERGSPNTTGLPKIDPLTGISVQLSKDEAPKVASIVRSMESKLQSSQTSGPGRGPQESQMPFRYLGKVGRRIEESLSSAFQMPLTQLLSKQKRGKKWSMLRLHSETHDSDDEESASETEDIISTESPHDDQNMQLKCATCK